MNKIFKQILSFSLLSFSTYFLLLIVFNAERLNSANIILLLILLFLIKKALKIIFLTFDFYKEDVNYLLLLSVAVTFSIVFIKTNEHSDKGLAFVISVLSSITVYLISFIVLKINNNKS